MRIGRCVTVGGGVIATEGDERLTIEGPGVERRACLVDVGGACDAGHGRRIPLTRGEPAQLRARLLLRMRRHPGAQRLHRHVFTADDAALHQHATNAGVGQSALCRI